MPDVVSLLAELVALPSVNPCGGPLDDLHGEGRVVSFLADWLRAQKLDFELQEVWPGRHNVIARLEGGDGPSLVFEAHTDTVEIHNMEIEPFTPRIADGRLYGRGSCDCKASLAAMLIALLQTAQRGTPPGPITLVAAVDEEFRFTGVKHLVGGGFRADGAVVGEPTGLNLVIAHKGALRAQIITHGRAAHSSEPHKGESAIFHMGHLLLALEEYGRELAHYPRHALVQGPTVSVGLISGGSAPNIVPDRCEIAIDRRVTPLEEIAEVEESLQRWLTEHLPGITWEYRTVLADGGLDGSADSFVAQRCAAALDRVTGRHSVAGVQYGTDASKFAAAGTPAVVLGPGDIAQAHTTLEWIDLEQVETAGLVYREIMRGGD